MARIKVKEDDFSIAVAAKRVRGESVGSGKNKKEEIIESVEPSRRKVAMSRAQYGIIVLLVVVVCLATLAYSLRASNHDLRSEIQSLKKDPAIIARQENNKLLTRVAAIVELPKGETPTIADVTDVEAAKKQDAFYKDARNGDKVLFYTQAGQAILYRPSTNKVVTTAPITKPQQP